MKKSILLGLVLGATACVPEEPTGSSVTGPSEDDAFVSSNITINPMQVGSETTVLFESDAFAAAQTNQQNTLVWQRNLHSADASYIAPHFSRFELPDGAHLVVRSLDSRRSWTYTGFGKSDAPMKDGFWGIHIPGDIAVIELYASVPVPAQAVVIDRFAHGFPRGGFGTEAICGADDSEWAQCYASTEIYDNSRGVVRLTINGSGACTGWLVGDQGHLLTNNHCIGNASDAANTDYEFDAEGATCGTNCASFGACPGVVEASGATFIQTDVALDYTLVKLPASLAAQYGYLQLREAGAVVGERIYIPGHPAAWGKRFAVRSTAPQNPSGFCEVDSITERNCTGGANDEVGYFCDTQGGSSGSPVIANSDHCVVALHHCANCENRGIRIQNVINDLGGNLPPNALCGGAPPPPPPPPPDCGEGAIDFSAETLVSYSNQDAAGDMAVEDGGATLRLTNNTWKRTSRTFQVTADTVLEFEFASGSQGEIHAIGFDANDDLNDSPAHFQFWGSQNWTGTGKLNSPQQYSGSGNFETFSIPVGQSYTGTMRLVLTNDNDAGSGNESRFRCVRVVDDASPPPPPPPGCAVDEGFEDGATGWTTSGDCSTGTFVVGTPTQQVNGGVTTQVGGANRGSSALFTATNSSAGNADVDGGECVVTSPVFPVANASTLSAAYFHGQRDAGDDAGDYFALEVSIDGGGFTPLAAHGDETVNAAWTDVASQVPAGSSVQLRVRVSDGAGPGDLVEAGIDDVRICDN